LLGFFTSSPVQTALAVSAGAAIVSAVIGVFTIIRGQSFAGHALADISSAGGAAAYLVGVSPMLGFLGVAVIGAGALEVLGVKRAAERDLVTGIVLGAGLGLTALLLYFDVTARSTTGAAVSVMFGSMFAIPPAIVVPALLIGAGAVALRLTRQAGAAIALAAGIGLVSAWGGIALAYESYGWTPGRTWPVSFFIVTIVFAFYLLSGLRARAA